MDRRSAAVYGADDKKWEVKSLKRLTFDGNYCDIAQCAETRGGSFCEDGACSQRKVWERLKEWEDLEEQGRVIVMKNPEQDGMARLRELADADRAGRLVVLPCKPDGSMLNTSDPERPEIMKRIHFAVAYVCGGIVFHQPYNIFLENIAAGYIRPLNEEAEKALEEMKDGN